MRELFEEEPFFEMVEDEAVVEEAPVQVVEEVAPVDAPLEVAKEEIAKELAPVEVAVEEVAEEVKAPVEVVEEVAPVEAPLKVAEEVVPVEAPLEVVEEVAEEEAPVQVVKEEVVEVEAFEEVAEEVAPVDAPLEVAAEEIVEEKLPQEVVEEETIEEEPVKKVALPRGPLRAAQVMLFEGKKDYSEIAAELRSLKQSGVDTVIVRAFHNIGDRLYTHVDPRRLPPGGQGFYFETAHAPVVADILSELIPLAHSEGLKIFAWMTTRYANYGIEQREEFACTAYDFKSKEYVKCKGLDLFNEEVVLRLEAIYRDLAKYEIDGILFQDDLVLRHNEGYGEHAAEGFLNDTGNRLDPGSFYLPRANSKVIDYTEEFWQWAEWKNSKLLAVASRMKEVVKLERPDALFAINFMYEAVTNPGAGLAWLSQDLTAALDVGFDYYSIMAYHLQMGEELRLTPEETRKLIASLVEDATAVVGEPEKVLIKLQSIDWHTREAVPVEELLDLARVVHGVAPVSLAVVPYREDFPYYELDTDELALRGPVGFK